MKEAIRSLASRAAVSTGLTAAGRALFPKRGAVILYGHRLAGDCEGYLQGLRPDWLDAQIAYLARHYETIPLSRLLACYEERRVVPGRSIVLTFDDGFRDNLTEGLPILRRHGVTATVFVVTGCISSGELPWPQRLGFMFQRSELQSFTFQPDMPGASPRHVALDSAAGRHAAYLAVKEYLKPLGREQREAWLARLQRELGVEPPRDRMLSWSDLRELRAAGWEIGAHTFSHPWLARIPCAEAREEMERCREELWEHLGIERPSFCFPAGSCSEELRVLARELGFRSAFQPNPPRRVNTLAGSDPFSLGRMGLPNAPRMVLEAELDGPFHTLRRLYRRPVSGRESDR